MFIERLDLEGSTVEAQVTCPKEESGTAMV